MARDRQPGKLAVILHADVAASTSMVRQDEQLAHERIRDSFNRFTDAINRHSGRVIELRGDALLAEFQKPSDAVAATLAFQHVHAEFLSSLDDDLLPRVRVGIAMGEIVVADNTATGAGVVLAQRVEQLAEPGGLRITAAIHEALSRRLPLELEDLGEQQLKGFDYPTRVYRVSLGAGASATELEDATRSGKAGITSPSFVAAFILSLLVIAGLPYWLLGGPSTSDKPAIAVLPFDNLSDDPAQEYFADGMAEDLITDLSKISGLIVIARNSSFSYKGKQLKVQQVAAELGVRYVLEGSVRRAGDQLRINAQLIDADSGSHMWAERYDGLLDDIFALQDRVTASIVEALALELSPREKSQLEARDTTSAEAHDAYLQGLSFYLRNTPQDNARAEAPLKRALELDPGYRRAYATLAKVYYKGAFDLEWSTALGIYYRKASFYAYQNLARSEGANLVEAHVMRSQMARFKHQVGVALDEAGRALEISSNDVEALRARAFALVLSGDYGGGREIAERTMRLDPVVIAEPLYLIGLSYFAEGDYAKAVEVVERAIRSDPQTSFYSLLLSAAYGKLGNADKANQHWLRFRKPLRGQPVWIAVAVFTYPFADDRILQNLADGFEAAGAVERPPARYLKLIRETRLSGAEIESLLFGNTINGTGYFSGNAWQQEISSRGRIRHTGISIHSGFNDTVEEADSWIDDDRLCYLWFHDSGDVTICNLVFRDTARGPGHYYMAADDGPHPFQLAD